MSWPLHLYWGAITLIAASLIARGIATAGEWIGKALVRSHDAGLAPPREPHPPSRRAAP